MSLLEATDTRRNRLGFCLQRAAPHFSTIQLFETLLCDAESCSGCSGTLDGGKINRFVGLLVVQPPTLAAVGGTRFDVEYGADIWEARDLLESRVTMGKTVWPVGAINAFSAAVRVVIPVARGDFIGVKEGLLDFVIRGVVQVLGRGCIATCGHGASDVREEECEDECSEIDHCETQGCTRRSLARG